MDKHLAILAKKHIETRFVKINAEKSPFLAEKLKIVVLPTLALIKNAKVDDYVVCYIERYVTFLLLLLLSLYLFLFVYVAALGCPNLGVHFRLDLMSLVEQMSSAQRNWRRGWLKLKLLFSRVNRLHYMHPSLLHNRGVSGKAQTHTLRIQTKSIYLTPMIAIEVH